MPRRGSNNRFLIFERPQLFEAFFVAICVCLCVCVCVCQEKEEEEGG